MLKSGTISEPYIVLSKKSKLQLDSGRFFVKFARGLKISRLSLTKHTQLLCETLNLTVPPKIWQKGMHQQMVYSRCSPNLILILFPTPQGYLLVVSRSSFHVERWRARSSPRVCRQQVNTSSARLEAPGVCFTRWFRGGECDGVVKLNQYIHD